MNRNLRVTLRSEDRPVTADEVLVRFGVWDNDTIRDKHDPDAMAIYRSALAGSDLMTRLVSNFGTAFAVLSVYRRPGPADVVPGESGDHDVDRWFATHLIASRYRRYREASAGALVDAGFQLLPTDIHRRRETDGLWELQGEDHFDIVVSDLSDETLNTVLACFTPLGELVNPFRQPRKTR
jgi:hypothetical protein